MKMPYMESPSITPIGGTMMYVGATAPAGWLLDNGETIGDVGSGADHEGADFETLFDILKGNGFGNAGTESFSGGDTVKLPNVQGVGVTGAGTQNINARAKGGDSLGDTVEDAIQEHGHSQTYNPWVYLAGEELGTAGGGQPANTTGQLTGAMNTTGGNGAPRPSTGADSATRISSVVFNFITRYI